MIEAFFAVFAVAFALTIFSFIILEQDTREKSYRPAYLLFIAIIAWLSTIGLLITPSTTTLSIPAYTVLTTNAVSGSSNIMVQNFPAVTQTTTNNSPLPTYAFYEYMAFAGGMALIDIIFFITFLLKMSVVEITDAGKTLIDK